jgi:hypothetical protein
MATRKVTPGTPIRDALTARFYNDTVDVQAAFKSGRLGVGGQQQSLARQLGLDIVRVKNTSETDAPLGGVLGLSSWIFDPGDGLPQFKSQGANFTCVSPVEADHFGSFVVPVETIAAGRIGWAAISGVCKVQLDVDDTTDMFAHPITADFNKLQAGPVGTCRILVKESGTGTKWALVQLGCGKIRGRFTLNEALSAGGDAAADLTRPDGSGDWEDSSRDYDLYDDIGSLEGETDTVALAEWDFGQKRWSIYQMACEPPA